jgi:hypothetical protein
MTHRYMDPIKTMATPQDYSVSIRVKTAIPGTCTKQHSCTSTTSSTSNMSTQVSGAASWDRHIPESWPHNEFTQQRLAPADTAHKMWAHTFCQPYITNCDAVVIIKCPPPYSQEVKMRVDACFNTKYSIHTALEEFFTWTPARRKTPYPPLPPIEKLCYTCRDDGVELCGWLDELPRFYHGCVICCDLL